MNAVPVSMAMKSDKSERKPVFPPSNAIDLDRVVFDPEYRAQVRDAVNRAGRTSPAGHSTGNRA